MKIRLTACWVLLGMMTGLVLAIISPLRNILPIQGDLSNYVVHLAVMGIPLAVLAASTTMSRWLRIFLVTAGASASGWLASLKLHALLTPFLPTEPVTYILVFMVLPITFLFGVLGAASMGINQLIKRQRGLQH